MWGDLAFLHGWQNDTVMTAVLAVGVECCVRQPFSEQRRRLDEDRRKVQERNRTGEFLNQAVSGRVQELERG